MLIYIAAHISSGIGYGSFEAGFILPLPFIFTVRWIIVRNQLAVIVENQGGIDFLPDQFLIRRVEIKHADCIFQITKRSLFAPAEMVYFYKFVKGHFLFCKVGKQALISVFRDLEADNPQIHFIVFILKVNVIKWRVVHKNPIQSVFDGFGVVDTGDDLSERKIKIFIRKIHIGEHSVTVDFFHADNKLLPAFNKCGDQIVLFISAVADNNRSYRIIPVPDHLFQRIALVCLSGCIDINILKYLVQNIIQSIKVQLIESSGSCCWDVIGFLVLGIVADINVRAIARKQIIAFIDNM